MKFFLALVFAVGCAANLEHGHFAARQFVAMVHNAALKKLNAHHGRMLIDSATDAAIQKCLSGQNVPAACVTLSEKAGDMTGLSVDVVKQFCTGTPSCASQMSSAYTAALPCITEALKNVTAEKGGLDPAKMGDMISKVMCSKDAGGAYCMPKLTSMVTSMTGMSDPTKAADPTKMMAEMCPKLLCLGTCLDSLMSMMGDMMGGTSGMPPGINMGDMIKMMCGAATCPNPNYAGASTPLFFLTALLALTAQLFAR